LACSSSSLELKKSMILFLNFRVITFIFFFKEITFSLDSRSSSNSKWNSDGGLVSVVATGAGTDAVTLTGAVLTVSCSGKAA